MADYIDRDALKQEMYRRCIGTDEEMEKGRAKWDSGLWIRYKVFEDAIAVLPTRDVAPIITVDEGRFEISSIVRCKDCKHNYLKRMSGNTCCDLGMDLFQLNDYCSRGERKQE